MWNRCVKVFEQQRKKAVEKSSMVFKSMLSDTSHNLHDLTMIDLEMIQRIFILKQIDMLTTDEIHKKEPVKQKPKEASGFEIKPKAPVPRASFMKSKSEVHKPLMEMHDGIKVSEIFSYRKNEIKVGCKFVTLLECF